MPEHLARVSTRIAQAIRDFLSQTGTGRTFHADELRAHVAQRVGPTAPGSADRILRDLRQRIFARLLKLPPSYYGRMATGDLMSRAVPSTKIRLPVRTAAPPAAAATIGSAPIQTKPPSGLPCSSKFRSASIDSPRSRGTVNRSTTAATMQAAPSA